MLARIRAGPREEAVFERQLPQKELGGKRAGAVVRTGISGWVYPPWRGVFFPQGWPQKRELEYASRHVSSIEINGSFYSLQLPSSFERWRAETPENFVFSVKGGRFITHLKRLKDIEVPLANFFASGVLKLGEKLGPILWQLPPQFRYDPDRLETFFRLLPRSGSEAAELARLHDHRLSGRSWTEASGVLRIRHALEVRHPSFIDPHFIQLLRKHRIALVVADTAGNWPFLEDVTTDFVYVRLHGAEELYVSGYTDEALDIWAAKVRGWSRGESQPAGTRLLAPAAPMRASGREVFVYFDNDVKVRAPYDAMSLAYRLGIGPRPGLPPDPAMIKETARPIAEDSRWRFGRAKPVPKTSLR